MEQVSDYSTGMVDGPKGEKYRVWIMEQAGNVICANPACRGPLDVNTCLSVRFPSNKDKAITDMMYFCSWDCLATFVALNDSAQTLTEHLGVGPLASGDAPSAAAPSG
jgi:hypothetical protein